LMQSGLSSITRVPISPGRGHAASAGEAWWLGEPSFINSIYLASCYHFVSVRSNPKII
jgi:hypothetical protein